MRANFAAAKEEIEELQGRSQGASIVAEDLIGTAANALLPGDFNVIIECSAGTGFRFNPAFRQQIVLNLAPDYAPIYPPPGARWNRQAVNEPFVVNIAGRITLIAGADPLQLYAG